MEKVMPSFEYEPLVVSPKPKTLDEEEDKGDIAGAGPLGTKVVEDQETSEERIALRR